MDHKRKLPFGYRMEFGDITECPQEAETVRQIYEGYLAGASLKSLSGTLHKSDVPYLEGKTWNKNMVARILEDERYIGTERFPALIQREKFYAVADRRRQLAPPRTQTAAQKELRKLCGKPPSKAMEQTLLRLLNRLIDEPDTICSPGSDTGESLEIQRLRRELDEMLQARPVDEEAVRQKAMTLASLRLESIGSEEYETLRLRGTFVQREKMFDLDAELLRQSVQSIHYDNRTVRVLLKNHQILEESDLT